MELVELSKNLRALEPKLSLRLIEAFYMRINPYLLSLKYVCFIA